MDADHEARLNLVRHLEFFVTVAQERHFGRAAASLGIAQPPLSQGIRRLEASLGVVLFERGRHGAALTAVGHDLLPRARLVLTETAALRQAAARHARAGRHVRLGVIPELGARAAAAAAATAGDRSGTRVEVSTSSSVQLVEHVAGNLLDLAVVAHPVPLGGLTGGPVVGVPSDVLVPTVHRACAGGGPVTLRALSDLEFVVGVREANPAAFDLLVETVEVRGCTSPVLEVPNATAALALIAGGRAFTLTADPDLAADGVERRALVGDPVPLRVRVVHRTPSSTERTGPTAAVVETVVEAATEVVATLAQRPFPC